MQGAYALVRGAFKHIFEPHHYGDSNVCIVLSHEKSGWFDCTEPSLSTSLQGKQGVQGAHALVRGGSSTSNGTISNHMIKEIARCVEFCHMSSGWVRLYRTFSIYIVTRATRYAGCCALVRGGSSTSNLLEPSRTISLQR